MPTEFNDATHYGLFKGVGSLRTGNTFEVRQSELTLAALRSAGFLDNMVDGLVPPSIDKLWLDKNTDPSVLKEWNPVGFAWEKVTSQTLFGRLPYRGDWDDEPIYRPGDLVSFGGNVWIATAPSQNHQPIDDAYWDVFIDGSDYATAAQGALADTALQPTTGADQFGVSINSSRVYGRTRDTVSLLDYATSTASRTALQTGSVAVNSVWDDAVSEAVSLGISRVVIPAGNFEVATDQRLENPGLSVEGQGRKTILYKNGQNSLFRTLGTDPVVASGYSLTANVAAGASTIQMSSGDASALVLHQLYVLTDESAMFTGNTAKRGEFVRVRSVSGGTVTLWNFTKFSYATGSTAKLTSISWTEGVKYSNLHIEGDPLATPTSSNSFQEMFPIDMRWCRDAQVTGVSIHNSLLAGIFLHGCYGARVTDYTARNFGSNTTGTDDPSSDDGLPGFGYAIREDGLNEGFVASVLQIEQCRGGYDHTAGYSSIWNYGEATGSIISDGYHRDARGAAWGTHWCGYGISFRNLTALGGRRNGISVRARKTTVDGFTAIKTRGPAVWVRGGEGADPNLRGDNCTIRNITAIETNLGIDFEEAIDWREYGAVVDVARGTTVENVMAVETGGPIATIGSSGVARRNAYSNLTGRNVCRLAATKTFAVDVANANSDARIVIDGLTLHDDGRVTDVVRRGTADNGGVPIELSLSNVKAWGNTGRIVSSATNMLGVFVSDTNGPTRQGEQRRVTLWEDFDRSDLSGWALQKGSDASAKLPAHIAGSAISAIRLETGNAVTGTMAVNGSQINGRQLWRADRDGLVFEARTQIVGLAGNVCFIGLSVSGVSLQMPATLGAGNVMTVNSANFVGFLYDAAADTDNWWMVSALSSTGKKVDTGVAPSGYVVLRAEIDTAGNATFFFNGALAGTISAAVSPTAVMALVASAYCRDTTDDRFLDLDYLYAEQIR